MSFRESVDYLADRIGMPRYDSEEKVRFQKKPQPKHIKTPSSTNIFPDRPDTPETQTPIPDGVTLPKVGDWFSIFNPRAYDREAKLGKNGVKNYKPVRADVYRDIDGKPLSIVMRLHFSDGQKFYMPVRYGELPTEAPDCRILNVENGKRMGWVVGGYPKGGLAPIFGEDRLPIWKSHYDPGKSSILLVEGEKTADAAITGLGGRASDYAVLTPLGGGSSPGMGDWRRVIDQVMDVWSKSPRGSRIPLYIWPDADPIIERSDGNFEPQKNFVRKILYGLSKDFEKIGVNMADVVDCYRVIPPENSPKGWDIADAIEEGWSGRDLINHMSRSIVHLRIKTSEPKSEPAPNADLAM